MYMIPINTQDLDNKRINKNINNIHILQVLQYNNIGVKMNSSIASQQHITITSEP